MRDALLDRILSIGFLLAYLSLMGGLMVSVIPMFENARSTILLAIMLPACGVGVALIIFEKIKRPPWKR